MKDESMARCARAWSSPSSKFVGLLATITSSSSSLFLLLLLLQWKVNERCPSFPLLSNRLRHFPCMLFLHSPSFAHMFRLINPLTFRLKHYPATQPSLQPTPTGAGETRGQRSTASTRHIARTDLF